MALETASLFATAFMIGLTGAITPGPFLTFTISESMKKGWTVAPILTAGHAVLELVMVYILFAGFGRIVSISRIGTLINLIGGSVLIWFGFSTVRDALSKSFDLETIDSHVHPSGPLISGMLISASNPYWTLWWLTIGANFIFIAAKSGMAGVAVFYLGHILADFSWYVLVGIGASRSRAYIGMRAYSIILGVCGGFMLVLGLIFLGSGLFSRALP